MTEVRLRKRQTNHVNDDGKEPIVEIDKRTLSHTNNVKDLKSVRDLPVQCNDCRFRSKEEGGNGLCEKYQKDSLCRIRPDIARIVDKYGIAATDQVLPQLKEEYDENYEELKFYHHMEKRAGQLDPEVTKRMSIQMNLAKIINEIQTKKTTIELSEKTKLSDDQRKEIHRIITLSKETSDEFDKTN